MLRNSAKVITIFERCHSAPNFTISHIEEDIIGVQIKQTFDKNNTETFYIHGENLVTLKFLVDEAIEQANSQL